MNIAKFRKSESLLWTATIYLHMDTLVGAALSLSHIDPDLLDCTYSYAIARSVRLIQIYK